jgi:hypothetical protein
MEKDEEILDENSIGDLADDETNTDIDDMEEKPFDMDEEKEEDETKDLTKKEEELLSSETEFGEDPEYDDSVDDFDADL